MGRYDKIKVYDGSGWKRPTQIQVYNNGTWVSLGTTDSSNTKTLSVYNNGVPVRATLNKTMSTVSGDVYTIGSKMALTSTDSSGRLIRYCHEKSKGAWFFRATIRKTSDTAMNVFYLGNSSNYIRITWNANGTITATNLSSYQGESYSVTTTNSVGANQWVYLDVTAPKDGAKVTITFNGVATTGSFYGTWYNNSVAYDIGQTGLHYKGNLSIQGRDYNNGLVSKTVNMSNSSDVANNFSGAQVIDDSTPVVNWT